ncbi:MAG: hypothetical protein IPM91_17370 [Bacteroidetes bacterium]|nr:hypothetical protein [Bacteroidota bacterium]
MNENSRWQNICAPITDCNPPPTGPQGVWTPIAGTTVADWTTVLSNVTDVLFRVDFSAAVGEASGFDNVCINSNVPAIDAGNDTTVCAGTVISLHVEGCYGYPEWYEMSGDTFSVCWKWSNCRCYSHPKHTLYCYLLWCWNLLLRYGYGLC